MVILIANTLIIFLTSPLLFLSASNPGAIIIVNHDFDNPIWFVMVCVGSSSTAVSPSLLLRHGSSNPNRSQGEHVQSLIYFATLCLSFCDYNAMN